MIGEKFSFTATIFILVLVVNTLQFPWAIFLVAMALLLAFPRIRIEKETVYRMIILSISGVIAAIFLYLAIFVQIGRISRIGAIALSPSNSLDFAVFAILASIGPYSFYEYRRFRRINQIEERFPEFLRDLSESRKAGMTMAMTVEMAAKGDYGRLTPEIRKMAIQISWGTSFERALKLFSERVKTPLIEKTTALVMKASEAGGRISDVIEAAAKDLREIKILQADRKMEMKMYLMIIYVTFFVFLAVIGILSANFIPQLIEATQKTGELLGGGGSIEEYHFLYFSIALVQAIGNGIVAGILGEGNVSAGLRHGFIMVIIAYLAFKLII